MTFDFQNAHTWYVVAAYAVAAIGYGALILHTVLNAHAVNKRGKHP